MCRGPWGHKESDMTERPKNSNNTCIWVSRGVLVVKTISNAGGMRCGSSLGGKVPLGEGTVTHSGVLAWRTSWTEEPGDLQSMGSQSQTRLRK